MTDNPSPDPRARAALFVRVPGLRVVGDQRGDMIRLCRARGYEIAAVFEESSTRRTAKRAAAYDALKLGAHRGEWHVLVVDALDSLGASTAAAVQRLLELERIGIRVVSATETWLDLSGVSREPLTAAFSWFLAQERARVATRSKAGIERARREGKTIGRPRVTVDLPRALNLRAEGMSIRQIARLLKIGGSTLHRTLQTHDALASAEVFTSDALGANGDEDAALLGPRAQH